MRLNLLPPDRKKILADEHRYHITRMLCGLWLAGMFVLTSFFFTTKQILERRQASFAQRVSQSQAQTSETNRAIRSTIRAINDQLTFLAGEIPSAPSRTHAMQTLANLVPKGTKFTLLTIGENQEVRISGIAQNRDAFLTLKDDFSTSPLLTNVRSPLSNIVARENIPFEISAILVPEEPSP